MARNRSEEPPQFSPVLNPPATQDIPLEEQSTQQLVDYALRTHKDTTDSAVRGLKAVEEAKQVQAAILANLDKQGNKMDKVNTQLVDMHEDLTYAEKLLSYMRRCCCCFLCDSCTGADPEDQKKKEWRRRVEANAAKASAKEGGAGAGAAAGAAAPATSAAPGQRQEGASNGSTAPTGYRMRDPEIKLGAEYRSQEMQLHEETRKQNNVLDQIHAGLENLMDGAKLINEEVSRQNKELEEVDDKLQRNKDRIRDMNKNTQLRNLGRSVPNTQPSPIIPPKHTIAMAAAKKAAGL